jgi:hypothetical protein
MGEEFDENGKDGAWRHALKNFACGVSLAVLRLLID